MLILARTVVYYWMRHSCNSFLRNFKGKTLSLALLVLLLLQLYLILLSSLAVKFSCFSSSALHSDFSLLCLGCRSAAALLGPSLQLSLHQMSSSASTTLSSHKRIITAKPLEECSRQRALILAAFEKRINSMVASSHPRVFCIAASIFPCCHLRVCPSAAHRSGCCAYQTMILSQSWPQSWPCWTRFQHRTLY